MRVLLTNNTLAARAGTELYIRDVAVELLRRGHKPVVYSTHLGEVAEEIRRENVPVIASLEALGEPPDVIHAHHNYEAVAAMMLFPQVPAVSFCHGWKPWEETPLRFPQIRRYVTTSVLNRERLVAEGGIAPERIELLPNFFDARRFPPRSALPVSPRRALSFNNDVGEDTGLALLRTACKQCGIELDAAGLAAGKGEQNPGKRLAFYDLVFARGRSAIEAMAVGAAVVLCDVGRLGPMVRSERFAELQSMNFALQALTEPFTGDGLVRAIRSYDAQDAGKVSERVRRECELKGAVDRIVSVYESALSPSAPVALESCHLALVRYMEEAARHYKASLLAEQRLAFKGVALERDAAIGEAGRLRSELAAIRGSVTWRCVESIFQNKLVRSVFGSRTYKSVP